MRETSADRAMTAPPRLAHRLRRAARDDAWGLAVTALVLVVYLAMYIVEPRSHAPGSDGHYTWLYARSLVFDGDVDMRNDFAVCGDPFRVAARTGRSLNLFYAGPALVWAPLLAIARRAVSTAGLGPAEIAGCRGPLPALVLAAAPLVGALCAWLCYRVARRHASDGVSALATAIFAFTGPLAATATVLPSYTHVFSAAAVALAVLFAQRAAERPEAPLRWLAAGLALAWAFLGRPSTLAFALVPLAALARAPALDRKRRATALLALALGVAPGLLAQLWIYRAIFGSFFVVPQGRHYLHFAHTHPWLLLFSQRGGLFFTAPAAWLAVLGLPRALRRAEGRALILAACAAGAIEIFVNSAALDWSGSASFTARRLAPLTPLFVLLSALVLSRARDALLARPRRAVQALAITALLVAGGSSLGWIRATPLEKVPTDRPVTQEELYGRGAAEAWAMLDRSLGAVAVLPSTLFLRARYGLSPRQLVVAMDDRWYARDFLTLRPVADTLSFTDASTRQLLAEGFVPANGGVSLAGPRGRIVFAAQWPFATRIEIRGSAPAPVRVRVTRRGPLGDATVYGEVELGEALETRSLAVPAGGFDSGLNELVFEAEPGPSTIASIRILDETPRPPAY
jgi:hypothetical protein